MAGAVAVGFFAAGYAFAEVGTKDGKIGPAALGRTRWLTTAVFLDGHPETNVKGDYLGVVGLSMWDVQTNRYEFFDPATGESKLEHGGGGYFFFTGDGKHHVNVPDGGHSVVVRKLETLNDRQFIYSRIVPEKFIEGSPLVKIYVVHRPYHGSLNTQFTTQSAGSGSGSRL
jgi:hypothetical protein